MACVINFLKIDKLDKFRTCDGKLMSNELLIINIESAVKDERYEWANECKLELERRGIKLII